MPIVAEGCLANSALIHTTRSSNNSCTTPKYFDYDLKVLNENRFLVEMEIYFRAL